MEKDNRNPSEVTDGYWVYAFNETNNYQLERGNSGKWMLFEHIDDVDVVWIKVREAIRKGLLGNSAKVSTAKVNNNALFSNYQVICVFTADFENKVDVKRIEKSLREIGIENKLVYKLDQDVGKYEHQGHMNLIQSFSYSKSYFSILETLLINNYQKGIVFLGLDENQKNKFLYERLEMSESEFEIEKRNLHRLGFQIDTTIRLDTNRFYFYEA